MILLKMKFLDNTREDALWMNDVIHDFGFYSWGTMAKYLNIIFRNNVPFEVVDISGKDDLNGRDYTLSGYVACNEGTCKDHWNENNLFHAILMGRNDQIPLEAVARINRRVKLRQEIF